MEYSGKEHGVRMEHDHKDRVQILREKGVIPTLTIFQSVDSKVIDTYVAMKKKYADAIGVYIKHLYVPSASLQEKITEENHDTNVHGIIVQLPLESGVDGSVYTSMVHPKKDVDGLAPHTYHVPPTAQAVRAMLQNMNVPYTTTPIAIVGYGNLVGKPVDALLKKEHCKTTIFTKGDDLRTLQNFRIIVSGVGVAHVLNSDHIASGAYVIDAGTSEDGESIVGDVAREVRERADVHINTERGSIGFLTVRYLFENLILVAEQRLVD